MGRTGQGGSGIAATLGAAWPWCQRTEHTRTQEETQPSPGLGSPAPTLTIPKQLQRDSFLLSVCQGLDSGGHLQTDSCGTVLVELIAGCDLFLAHAAPPPPAPLIPGA